MKQHTNSLLTRCVLPLMCFNDEDAELWRDDPHEYIRKVLPARCPGIIHASIGFGTAGMACFRHALLLYVLCI